MFGKKASTLETVRDTVAGYMHEALSHLPTERRKELSLKDLKESVGDAVTHAWEAVAQKVEDVSHSAEAVAHKLPPLPAMPSLPQIPKPHLPKPHLPKLPSRKAASAAVKASAEAARDTAEDAVPDYEIRHKSTADDLTRNLLWLGVGLLAGSVLALLLAPNTGRRSRALLKDKLGKAGHDAADLGASAAGKVSDLKRRATGLAHDVQGRVRGEEDSADDRTIADRVRTELGQNVATRNLEGLNVTCADGVVTLHGPMVGAPAHAMIEAIVRGVKGVRDVQNELLVEPAAEDEDAFVG